MSNQFGEPAPLTISNRVVAKQAELTIKNPLDVLVELITNSDDSYTKSDLPQNETSITIYTIQDKKLCKEIRVLDKQQE